MISQILERLLKLRSDSRKRHNCCLVILYYGIIEKSGT